VENIVVSYVEAGNFWDDPRITRCCLLYHTYNEMSLDTMFNEISTKR